MERIGRFIVVIAVLTFQLPVVIVMENDDFTPSQLAKYTSPLSNVIPIPLEPTRPMTSITDLCPFLTTARNRLRATASKKTVKNLRKKRKIEWLPSRITETPDVMVTTEQHPNSFKLDGRGHPNVIVKESYKECLNIWGKLANMLTTAYPDLNLNDFQPLHDGKSGFDHNTVRKCHHIYKAYILPDSLFIKLVSRIDPKLREEKIYAELVKSFRAFQRAIAYNGEHVYGNTKHVFSLYQLPSETVRDIVATLKTDNARRCIENTTENYPTENYLDDYEDYNDHVNEIHRLATISANTTEWNDLPNNKTPSSSLTGSNVYYGTGILIFLACYCMKKFADYVSFVLSKLGYKNK